MTLIVNVYGYNVHYIKKSDGTIMYFAADIVKMFNTRNNTRKQLRYCLENKDTHDLIKVISENSKKITDITQAGKNRDGILKRKNVWYTPGRKFRLRVIKEEKYLEC